MDNFRDIFISYGRADSKEFATKLSQRLLSANVTVWLDVNDIPLGVDYQAQIDRDLEGADNVLFVISPHSVNSPYCALELSHALQCNKRIIPVLHVEEIERDTWKQRHPGAKDDDWQTFVAAGKHSSFSNMHPAIAKINWVYCREGIDDFESAIAGIPLISLTRIFVINQTVVLD
ncbi:MAG: toll/interleukin-1 receptor domain-containing protein [Leptolyngbyaceae cyanobacterium MAG.088]|nr:toll/interleukin-1 receptor domain-containing protein [Leptolyngbyaceae cyanobacterium MAG.088]